MSGEGNFRLGTCPMSVAVRQLAGWQRGALLGEVRKLNSGCRHLETFVEPNRGGEEEQ